MVLCLETIKAQNSMAAVSAPAQRALGLHPALELSVQAFDGVGGSQGLPLLRRISAANISRANKVANMTDARYRNALGGLDHLAKYKLM